MNQDVSTGANNRNSMLMENVYHDVEQSPTCIMVAGDSMSPTLLEAVVAIIVIVLAWQIGLALAPDVFRLLRSLKRDIDDATTEALADDPPPISSDSHQEEPHDPK